MVGGRERGVLSIFVPRQLSWVSFSPQFISSFFSLLNCRLLYPSSQPHSFYFLLTYFKFLPPHSCQSSRTCQYKTNHKQQSSSRLPSPLSPFPWEIVKEVGWKRLTLWSYSAPSLQVLNIVLSTQRVANRGDFASVEILKHIRMPEYFSANSAKVFAIR